MFKKHRYF